MSEIRGTRPGEVVRSSRRRNQERNLPKYIQILESFGYTVSRTDPKPDPKPKKDDRADATVLTPSRPTPEPSGPEPEPSAPDAGGTATVGSTRRTVKKRQPKS